MLPTSKDSSELAALNENSHSRRLSDLQQSMKVLRSKFQIATHTADFRQGLNKSGVSDAKE